MTQGPFVQRSGRGQSLLALVSAGCALTVLDTNVVGMVLPAIARDLHASFAAVEWVVSSYVLVFAALLLPAGVIADRYGRRRLFLAGIATFGLASLACGLAGSAAGLAFARALQGLGAAFLIAPALAIMGHRFQRKDERAHAWAIWGSVMGMTMVVSPLIGGFISSAYGWRWAFYINAPICLALLFAAPRFIGESRDAQPRGLDLAGMAIFVLCMLSFTAALILGPHRGWAAPAVVACWLCGASLLSLFIALERRVAHPMLELALFRQRSLRGAIVAMFAYAACAQVMASLLPLYLQGALGHRPIAAGVSMLPFALAMLLFPRVGRWLGTHWESHAVLALGLLAVSVGNAWLFMVARDAAHHGLPGSMALLGAGGGLLNGETQKAIMTQVPPQRAGMASGISTTSRFTGILLGFSGLGAVLASGTLRALAADPMLRERHAALSVDQIVAGDFSAAASALDSWQVARIRMDYSGAFANVFLLAALAAGAAAVFVLFTMRPAIARQDI